MLSQDRTAGWEISTLQIKLKPHGTQQNFIVITGAANERFFPKMTEVSKINFYVRGPETILVIIALDMPLKNIYLLGYLRGTIVVSKVLE